MYFVFLLLFCWNVLYIDLIGNLIYLDDTRTSFQMHSGASDWAAVSEASYLILL